MKTDVRPGKVFMHGSLCWVVATFVFILPSTIAWADYYDGLRAYDADQFARAAELWLAAASGGDRKSQFEIANLYLLGQGVPKNLIEAHRWFNLAGSQGLTVARDARDEIAEYMTVEQISEAQSLAENWHAKLPDRKNSTSTEEQVSVAKPPPSTDKEKSVVSKPTAQPVISSKRPKPLAIVPTTNAGTKDTPASVKTKDATLTTMQENAAAKKRQKQVTKAQKFLVQLGFDPGKIDGRYGENTRAAVTAFQLRENMPERGIVNSFLVRQLEASVKRIGRSKAVDRPLAYPD